MDVEQHVIELVRDVQQHVMLHIAPVHVIKVVVDVKAQAIIKLLGKLKK